MALTLAALVALCFPPLVPIAPLFHFSVSKFDRPAIEDGLSNSDVKEILAVVAQDSEYPGESRYPNYISVKEYFFYYSEIGVLGVASIPDGWAGRCEECSVIVDTGMTCGGLCGVGIYFYLTKTDDGWTIANRSYWVS